MKKRSFAAGLCAGFFLPCLLLAALLFTNFGNLGNQARVAALIQAEALEPIGLTDLMDGAAKGMVEELEDPYSVYLEPKDYETLEDSMSGSYGGLGIYVGVPEETKRLTVMAPIKGTPAARAGIKSGDEIWKIDGQDAAQMDMDKAVSLMKGEPGTSVQLGIKREGQADLILLDLVREVIQIPSVETQVLPDYPGIAYVSVSMFNENTGAELGEAVAKIRGDQAVQGLLLDLRNNPGGSLNAAIEAAGYFVPAGQPVVWLVDRRNTVSFPSTGQLFGLPTVVLINNGSASASEILAGAIKDTKAGTLVGETSFGKGIVQSVIPLDQGAALKLTTAKYLTPNKTDIHKKGIVPDVPAALAEDADPGVVYSLDPALDNQLKKGLEVLAGKIGK